MRIWINRTSQPVAHQLATGLMKKVRTVECYDIFSTDDFEIAEKINTCKSHEIIGCNGCNNCTGQLLIFNK